MADASHGLILNNRIYPIDELPELCSVIQNSDEPEWKKNIFTFIAEWIQDDEYIIQETSGTTGDKKQIRLSKQSMTASALKTCEYFDLKFGCNVLLCLPVEFIAGKMMVVRALVGGLNLLMTEPTSMPKIAGLGDIDFCSMVPLQAYNSLNSVDTLRRIKKLLIGGAEIRDELETMLRDMPNEVYASYGMAESCSHVAVRRLSGSDPERYYNAISGVSFGIDKRNCLTISADHLDEAIITNDVIDLIDNQKFRWIGRYDNLINSGGIKIVPEEVEGAISKATGYDCAAIGLPDTSLGQKVVLVVEQGNEKIDVDELYTIIEKELPKHMRPKDIELVDSLPRNHSYKVDRKKLKRHLLSL